MGILDSINERVKTGMPVLVEIFNMPHLELRAKLKSILKNNDRFKDYEMVIDKGDVKKISTNDEPWEININFYDSIEINFMGVSLKREHGSPKLVVAFDEHFKL